MIDDYGSYRIQPDIATVDVRGNLQLRGQLSPDEAAITDGILRTPPIATYLAKPIVEDSGIHARTGLSGARIAGGDRDINLVVGENRREGRD